MNVDGGFIISGTVFSVCAVVGTLTACFGVGYAIGKDIGERERRNR